MKIPDVKVVDSTEHCWELTLVVTLGKMIGYKSKYVNMLNACIFIKFHELLGHFFQHISWTFMKIHELFQLGNVNFYETDPLLQTVSGWGPKIYNWWLYGLSHK